MNLPLTLADRAESYHDAFPKYPPLVVSQDGRWLYGIWQMGNDYRNKDPYYGCYPRSYVERVAALFPEVTYQNRLHVFAGSVTAPGVKVDLRWLGPKPRDAVEGDAERLSELFPKRRFELVMADPPYSVADAEKYGVPMPNRKKVIEEIFKVVRPGGHLVWLDTVKPMYRNREWRNVAEIGLARSTNHRVRMVFIFERVGA